MTLQECQDACHAEPRCEAVVVLRDFTRGLCFLRAAVDVLDCQASTPYDLWLVKVGSGAASRSLEQPMGPTGETTPRPPAAGNLRQGVNCYGGAGADAVVPGGADPLSLKMSHEECRAACRELAPECQGAVVFSLRPVGPCFLRTGLDLSACATDTNYDLWLEDSFAAALEGGGETS